MEDMKTEELTIRNVTVDDAERLLEIYAPYVERTAITYETRVPSPEEFRDRIRATLRRYPYIAAERGGRIVGYAYAGPFKQRASYNWSCETTVYVDASEHGSGIGRSLYRALEARLREQGIRNMYACIAYPENEDEYLDLGSVRFHTKLGFTKCGEFHNCANKFGRWYNMTWMEKMIADHPADPPAVLWRTGDCT